MRNDRTNGRILKGRGGPVAREHVVCASFVRRLTVSHGANDGDLIRNLSHVGHVLAELLAFDGGIYGAEGPAVFGWSAILGVESLLVRGSPWEEDVNNRFRDALAGLIKFLGALGFHAEELREGQPEAAKHSYIEELTPGVVPGQWVAGTRYVFHGLPTRRC